MKLGEYINKYLSEHEMSMRQFADKCNLSHQTIAYIINDRLPNGKQPNITQKTGKQIAKALGLKDINDLASVADFELSWGKQPNDRTIISEEEIDPSIMSLITKLEDSPQSVRNAAIAAALAVLSSDLSQE